MPRDEGKGNGMRRNAREGDGDGAMSIGCRVRGCIRGIRGRVRAGTEEDLEAAGTPLALVSSCARALLSSCPLAFQVGLTVLGRPGVGRQQGVRHIIAARDEARPPVLAADQRDAGPYLRAERAISEATGTHRLSTRLSTLYSALLLCIPHSVLCTQSNQRAHLPAGQLTSPYSP